MRTILVAVSALAMLAGCSTTSTETETATTAPAVDPSSPLAAPTYLAMAASGDQFEIQSSQLALQTSRNPAVQSFAQMLISDHSRLTSELMTAAQGAGLTPPPPALLPQHQALLDQLRATPPESFDMAYRDAQLTAHQQALQLHQNYASGGDNATLRAAASRAVPVIQGHLNHVQTLSVTAPPPPAPRSGERG